MTRRKQGGKCIRSAQSPAAEAPGNTMYLCGIAELGSRADYIEKHVHRSLHSEVYNLSDVELHSLGTHTFATQRELLDSFQGSECFGTRSFSMPRKSFLQQKIHESLRKSVGTLSDQELLQLSKFKGNQQEEEVVHMDAGPALALGRARLARSLYVEKFIHSDIQDQLSPLSDGALCVLGNRARQDQAEFLEQILKADAFLPVSRSLWLSRVSKNQELRPKMKVLGQLCDYEVFHLGRGKKGIEKYQARLQAMEEEQEEELTAKGSVAESKAAGDEPKSSSILTGVLEALEDDELEPVFVIAAPEEAEQRLTMDWAKSLHQNVVGVAASGCLVRHGRLEHIAICAEKEEPVVVDIKGLSQHCSEERLFGELLQPLKEVLESPQVVKVCHDCRPVADLLADTYDVRLGLCFDTVEAWERLESKQQRPVDLEELARKYDHELSNALQEDAKRQKPATARLWHSWVPFYLFKGT